MSEIIETSKQDKTAVQNAQTVVKETSSWMHSVKAFSKKMESVYSVAFPDLAKPLQSSLSQTVHSVSTMTDLIKQLIAKIEQGPVLQNALTSLLEYPNAIPNKDAREKHLNRFVSANFMQLLNRSSSVVNEDAFQAELQCLE